MQELLGIGWTGKNSTTSVSCLTAPFLFSSTLWSSLRASKCPNPTMRGRQSQLQRCQCLTLKRRGQNPPINNNTRVHSYRVPSGRGEWGTGVPTSPLRSAWEHRRSRAGVASIPASSYCFLIQATPSHYSCQPAGTHLENQAGRPG